MTSTNTKPPTMRDVDEALTALDRAIGAYTRVTELITDEAHHLDRDMTSIYELTVAVEAVRLNVAQRITDLRATWLACFPPAPATAEEPG